jgi:hypothetical protein
MRSVYSDRGYSKYDDPLNDKRLVGRQVATGKLIKSLCEEEMFLIMTYGRWVDADYAPYANHMNPGIPEQEREATYQYMVGHVK